MRRAFDLVMRIVSTLLGLAMVCLGGIWMLQGLNLAFRVGFMVGDRRWVAWGALLVVVGACQAVWSNMRPRA